MTDLAMPDAAQGRDQGAEEPVLLAPMLSGMPSKTPHTKVPTGKLKELHDYSLLSLLAYSNEKKKVYTALAKHADPLFQTILPKGKAVKQEAYLHEDGDKFVRIVMREGTHAGGAEAVLTFVGPDDLRNYHPTKAVPVEAPVALLDSWPKDAVDTRDIRIHGTWLLAFNKLVKGERKDGRDLKEEVTKLAAQLGVQVDRITCVGHGTGGALATLAAFWMKKIAFPEVPVSCFTFGSPRVGNCPFAKEFDMTVPDCIRVVHKTDPLTDAPTFDSFEHVGKAVHMYEPRRDTHGAPTDVDDACYIALYMNSPAPLYSYKVRDSSVLKYVEGLQEASMGACVPGLAAEVQLQWGDFLKNRYLGLVDNPNASEVEVEAIVKQLMKIESGKVNLVDQPVHHKLFQYGSWAKAAYSHHVAKGANSALDHLKAAYPVEGTLLPGTLRLVHGMGRIGNSFFVLSNTDTQALMGLVDDGKDGVELVIAFRGSESKASDWLTNFSISMSGVEKLVKDGSVRLDRSWEIHNGFTEAVNDILQPDPKTCPLVGLSDGESNTPDDVSRTQFPNIVAIAEHLRTLADNKPITKVVTCGHSLGGALSKLAAYWCQKVGFKDVPVENYSFGAPRIANWEFAQEWRKTVKTAWRVVHRADPVPAIPFTSWLAGFEYCHVDNAVLLCQPGKEPFQAMDWPPVVDPEHYQAQQRRRPTPLTAVCKPGVGDHSMSVYLAALSNALEHHPSNLSTIDSLKANLSHMTQLLSESLSSTLPTRMSGQ